MISLLKMLFSKKLIIVNLIILAFIFLFFIFDIPEPRIIFIVAFLVLIVILLEKTSLFSIQVMSIIIMLLMYSAALYLLIYYSGSYIYNDIYMPHQMERRHHYEHLTEQEALEKFKSLSNLELESIICRYRAEEVLNILEGLKYNDNYNSKFDDNEIYRKLNSFPIDNIKKLILSSDQKVINEITNCVKLHIGGW